MTDRREGSPFSPSAVGVDHPYEPPRLEPLGSVAALTQANLGNTGDANGGSFTGASGHM